jgi:hypothetical protein
LVSLQKKKEEEEHDGNYKRNITIASLKRRSGEQKTTGSGK